MTKSEAMKRTAFEYVPVLIILPSPYETLFYTNEFNAHELPAQLNEAVRMRVQKDVSQHISHLINQFVSILTCGRVCKRSNTHTNAPVQCPNVRRCEELVGCTLQPLLRIYNDDLYRFR